MLSLEALILDNYGTYVISFLPLSNQCPSLPDMTFLTNHWLKNFGNFLFISGVKEILVSVTS